MILIVVVWPGDSRLAGSYQHNEPHQTPVLGWAFGFIHGRERFDVSPLRIITAVKSASLPENGHRSSAFRARDYGDPASRSRVLGRRITARRETA